jgi:hypothetical protein
MPVAKIHVLEGQYNEARLGKVSSAIQNGLISANSAGRLLPDNSHFASRPIPSYPVVPGAKLFERPNCAGDHLHLRPSQAEATGTAEGLERWRGRGCRNFSR